MTARTRRGFFASLSEPWFRLVSGGHRGPSRTRVPSKKCSVPGCPVTAAVGLGGLCSWCYVDLQLERQARPAKPEIAICELCPRPATYRLCRLHWKILASTNRLRRWKGFPEMTLAQYIADPGNRPSRRYSMAGHRKELQLLEMQSERM